MFEDDYLLRLIKEMVRTVLKLLFHIDFKEEDPVSVVFESEDAEKTLYSLIHSLIRDLLTMQKISYMISHRIQKIWNR